TRALISGRRAAIRTIDRIARDDSWTRPVQSQRAATLNRNADAKRIILLMIYDVVINRESPQVVMGQICLEINANKIVNTIIIVDVKVLAIDRCDGNVGGEMTQGVKSNGDVLGIAHIVIIDTADLQSDHEEIMQIKPFHKDMMTIAGIDN